MGGGAMPEGGGGGKRKKKSLDAVINVVPAIDLLSCCITFLLYTAVWTQISRLQVHQFGTGAPEPEQVEQKEKPTVVRLVLGERGMTLTVDEDPSQDIPLRRDGDRVNQDYAALTEKIKQLRAGHPAARAVILMSEDTVPYGDLVQAIDTCRGQGLDSVSVTGA